MSAPDKIWKVRTGNVFFACEMEGGVKGNHLHDFGSDWLQWELVSTYEGKPRVGLVSWGMYLICFPFQMSSDLEEMEK